MKIAAFNSHVSVYTNISLNRFTFTQMLLGGGGELRISPIFAKILNIIKPVEVRLILHL